MLRFRTVNTTLQSVTAHGLGVSVLIGFELGSCHNIISTQSGCIGWFLAVSLLNLFLFLLALALSLDYRYKGGVYMRCLLVHVQDCRHDILSAEGIGKVFQIVATPPIQSALVGDAFHILVRSRKQDTDCPHLVVADFACQSCGVQSVLYGLCPVLHPVGKPYQFPI